MNMILPELGEGIESVEITEICVKKGATIKKDDVLLTPHTVHVQLLHSSTRIFIPLVLLLSYFSVFLINKNFKNTKFH